MRRTRRWMRKGDISLKTHLVKWMIRCHMGV
jgi:hypothetical protein